MQEKTVDEYLEQLQWPPSLEKKLRAFADGSDTLEFSDLSEFIERLDIDELGRFYRSIPDEWSSWSATDFNGVGVGDFGKPPIFDWGFCYPQGRGKPPTELVFVREYEATLEDDASIHYPSLETKYGLSLIKKKYDNDECMLIARSLICGGERKTVVRFCGSSLPLRLGVESIRENPSNLPWLLSEVTKKNLDHFFPEVGMVKIYTLPIKSPYRVHFVPVDIKIINAEQELGIKYDDDSQFNKS